MKKWYKKFEWMAHGVCWGDERFTADSVDDHSALLDICCGCPVSVECASWALAQRVTGVFVAGVHIPDPGEGVRTGVNKSAVQAAYTELAEWLEEGGRCGEEI